MHCVVAQSAVPTRIKICGFTRLEEAQAAIELGVDAIGLNFWAGSKRRCSLEVARAIAVLARGRARAVGVFVDASERDIRWTLEETGVEWVQLHGDEPPELLRTLLPNAYRAVREAGELGLERIAAAPGVEVLLDASVPGQMGGTGVRADWQLAERAARTRPLWLAGGLNPTNVSDAVLRVRPLGVDVASGVESAPGVKSVGAMREFVNRVRGADAEVGRAF